MKCTILIVIAVIILSVTTFAFASAGTQGHTFWLDRATIKTIQTCPRCGPSIDWSTVEGFELEK